MERKDQILAAAAAIGVLGAGLRCRRERTLSSALYLAAAVTALAERLRG